RLATLEPPRGRRAATAAAFSSDGTRFALSWQGKVRLYDAKSLKQLHEFSPGELSFARLAFAADGKVLLALSDNGTMVGWSDSGKAMSVIGTFSEARQA